MLQWLIKIFLNDIIVIAIIIILPSSASTLASIA